MTSAVATVLAVCAAPTAVAGATVQDVGAPAAPVSYDSGLAPTPYMGWNTYYGLGAPTEEAVRAVADKLVASGLRDSGYDIVWLDGGWQADNPGTHKPGWWPTRTASPPASRRSSPTCTGAVCARASTPTCGAYDGGKSCGLGSRGHYDQDARQFADWKIDAIKVDFLCGIGAKLDPGPAFKEFSDAVAKSGRKMLLNLCNPLTEDWGLPHTPEQDAHNTYVYAPAIADSWRTGTDIAWGTPSPGQWPNVLRNMDANAWHPEAQSPGHYNDPDYLIPMRRISDGSYELTQEESTTQLVMWAEMASPLVIGSDPRTLSGSMIDALRNPEIIGVDQDPLAIQGVRVATDSTGDVYSKVLQGHGQRAVVLLNRSDRSAERTVKFSDTGLGGPVQVRDLRARADRGTHTGSYTVEVPAHGTAFLRLTGVDALPGASLGERATASPAVARAGDTTSTFFRGPHGSLVQLGDGRRRDLGGPAHGGILGQPAVYGSMRRADRRVRARRRLPGLPAGLRRRPLGPVAEPGRPADRGALRGVHRPRALDAVRARCRREDRAARSGHRLVIARRARRPARARAAVRGDRPAGAGPYRGAHRRGRRLDTDPGHRWTVVGVVLPRRDRQRQPHVGGRSATPWCCTRVPRTTRSGGSATKAMPGRAGRSSRSSRAPPSTGRWARSAAGTGPSTRSSAESTGPSTRSGSTRPRQVHTNQ